MVDLSITEPMAAASGGGGGQQDAAAGGGAAAAAAGAAASGVAAGQALTGNTYEVGSGSLLVPLLKDEAGALRVQVRGVLWRGVAWRGVAWRGVWLAAAQVEPASVSTRTRFAFLRTVSSPHMRRVST